MPPPRQMHAQSRKKKPKAVIPVPLKQQVGAGDVVKKITSALGIPTCGPCEARRRRLNALVVFGRRRG